MCVKSVLSINASYLSLKISTVFNNLFLNTLTVNLRLPLAKIISHLLTREFLWNSLFYLLFHLKMCRCVFYLILNKSSDRHNDLLHFWIYYYYLLEKVEVNKTHPIRHARRLSQGIRRQSLVSAQQPSRSSIHRKKSLGSRTGSLIGEFIKNRKIKNNK